jgi:tetratricopeptide (TPR) repeat protein
MNFLKMGIRINIIILMIAALMTSNLYSAIQGDLRITVLDSNGKPIEGVKITITDSIDKNLVHVVTTNKQGIAVQVSLPNHVLQVMLEKEGYRSIIKNIKMPPGRLLEKRITIPTIEESLHMQDNNSPQQQAINAFNEAVSSIKLKKYDEAIEQLKKSISLDETIFQSYYYLGVIYFEQGKFQDAVQALNDAIELNPEFEGAYRLLAATYEKLGDKKEAEKYTKLAQEKGGRKAADAYNDGIAAFNAGEMDKAVLAFNEAIQLDEKFAPAYFQLGMSYVNKGDNEKAITTLQKYLELKPEGEEAETAKAIIESLKLK